MADNQISHEEVWDDAVLQDSWNEALAEYKKYHSLAMKGERVTLETSISHAESIPKSSAAMKAESNVQGDALASSAGMPKPEPVMAQTAAATVPQVMLGNIQDEDLKNLMMSWYYAGYYTGLYEGKQQGYAMATQRVTE